jgi:peroxiredoxin
MLELVQLERRHEDFDKRKVRIVVVSMEDLETARKTQADFPHLLVLADKSAGLSAACGLIHEHEGPQQSDIDMPTTILIDGHGTVRWIYRPGEVIARLSPDDLLEAIARQLP